MRWLVVVTIALATGCSGAPESPSPITERIVVTIGAESSLTRLPSPPCCQSMFYFKNMPITIAKQDVVTMRFQASCGANGTYENALATLSKVPPSVTGMTGWTGHMLAPSYRTDEPTAVTFPLPAGRYIAELLWMDMLPAGCVITFDITHT